MPNLDKVVREYLIQSGETTLAKYSKAYQNGVSGLRELNMDLSGVPQVVNLPVSQADQVELPNDYIQYIQIGLAGPDGMVHALGNNPHINLSLSVNNCGVPQPPSMTVTSPTETDFINPDWDGFGDNFRNGENMGRFFGLGGGQNPYGYFRIDKRSNTIQLGGLGNGSVAITGIVLEYISNLSLIDGDYDVHPFIVETIKSWVHWKMISWDRSRSLGEKQMAEKEYFQNYRIAKMRCYAATVDEWLSALRSGNFASPKF
jgi:hypothetical protein